MASFILVYVLVLYDRIVRLNVLVPLETKCLAAVLLVEV